MGRYNFASKKSLPTCGKARWALSQFVYSMCLIFPNEAASHLHDKMNATSQWQDEMQCRRLYLQSATQCESWYNYIIAFCERYLSRISLYDNAIEVTNRALLISWCLVEYIDLLETFDIISRRYLDAYCNMGFSHYLPSCIMKFH